MSPALNDSARGGRLKELDGWRAVSVMLVVAYHMAVFQYARILAPHRHLAPAFNELGALGVKAFFVISGFVICRLLIFEELRYGSASLKGFYLRRVLRILPPFYLYVATVSLLLSIGLINDTWRGLLNGALFLYDIFPALRGSWFIGHAWSLAVEEQFYLIFPVLWVLTRGIGRNFIFPAIFCLIVAWNVFAAVSGRDQFTLPSARAGFACICCGVLMANFEAGARRIARAIPAVVVTPVALLLFWHPIDHSDWRSALYESVFMPLAISLVLLFSLERGELLRRFLCWKPVQAVGLTSYGIYLWQQLFTAPSRFFTASGQRIGFLLPLLLLIVPLSYRFIEKPAMKLGSSLGGRVRGVSASQKAMT
jgi:peptidoglycan/LPS O-acetylase OafA/YrhL